jgi:hypothetical protein
MIELAASRHLDGNVGGMANKMPHHWMSLGPSPAQKRTVSPGQAHTDS